MGEIEEVYAANSSVSYAIYDPDLEFDPYAIKLAEKFDKYEDLLEDLDAKFIENIEDL